MEKIKNDSSIIDDEKIFVRTELVFEMIDISKLFNIGCYMVQQSLFDTELKDNVNLCFNYCCKMRYTICENMQLIYN